MYSSFRRHKQIVIISVYILLFTLLGLGIYYAVKPAETCFDQKQNQDEQGVDCGGVCALACKEIVIGQDLEQREVSFVPGGSGRYDVLGKIHNPNDEAGASSFRYVFELKDASGQVVASRSGESFILPQQTKSLVEVNLETAGTPVSASLRLSGIGWEKFSGYQEPPAVNVYQRRYGEISSGAGFSEAYGLVSNESSYDFRSISVKVILRDGSGKLLALNTTEMRTIRSQEERDFRLIWPNSFPGTVEKVEMEVDADVYHSDNFMQQYLPGGKFQEFAPPQAY